MRQIPSRERELPPLDLGLKQRANTYALLMDGALQRYEDEGRPSVDPLAWVNPDAPELAKDMRFLALKQKTLDSGGVWLGGEDGYRHVEDARQELVVSTIYKYLEQAKKHGLDLMEMFYKQRPAWIRDMMENYDAWVQPENARNRFKKIEGWRGQKLYQQWQNELEQLPQNAQCLEIGCGSGFFTREVMKQQPSLHWKATDIPRPLPIDGTELDRNRQSWFAECSVGKPLPYADASQDAVFVNNVLHHVAPEYLDGFLKEARRVLKPGGKLMVTEEYAPRIDGDLLKDDLVKRGHSYVYEKMPEHFSEFVDSVFWPEDRGHQRVPEGWQHIAENSGFKMDKAPRIVGTFGTPGLPVMEACMVFQK